MSELVTERKISQLRDGSRGRLSNQDGGIPVNSRAVRKPDFLRGGESFKLMPNGAWQVRFSVARRSWGRIFIMRPGPTLKGAHKIYNQHTVTATPPTNPGTV